MRECTAKLVGGIGLGAVVCAVLLFWGSTTRVHQAPRASELNEVPRAIQGAAVANGSASLALAAADPGNRRHESSSPSYLLVESVDASGRPVTGSILYTTRNVPLIGATLTQPGPGVHVVEHDGRARLQVPNGHWTWACVNGTKPRPLARHLLVPPFEGVRHETVRLDANRRAIRVFARHAGLYRPAAGVDVYLYARDMKAAGAPELLARVRTDADGHALFDDLAPGAFILHAEGASFDDGAPFVQACVLPPGAWATDVPVILGVHEPRVPVQLRVQVAGAPAQRALPPRLFLRRLGDRDGAMLPIRATLAEGVQDVKVLVPPGSWAMDVLPLGALLFEGGTPVFEVAAERQYVVKLRGNTLLTELQLEDIERLQYPIRVVAESEAEVVADPESLLFLGPRHWHLSKMHVNGPPGEHRIVVVGRTAAYRSKEVVRFDGGLKVVHMEPATRILVEWLPETEPRAGVT